MMISGTTQARHLWDYDHPYHGADGYAVECTSFEERTRRATPARKADLARWAAERVRAQCERKLAELLRDDTNAPVAAGGDAA
jgi:hypothetical protein